MWSDPTAIQTAEKVSCRFSFVALADSHRSIGEVVCSANLSQPFAGEGETAPIDAVKSRGNGDREFCGQIFHGADFGFLKTDI